MRFLSKKGKFDPYYTTHYLAALHLFSKLTVFLLHILSDVRWTTKRRRICIIMCQVNFSLKYIKIQL